MEFSFAYIFFDYSLSSRIRISRCYIAPRWLDFQEVDKPNKSSMLFLQRVIKAFSLIFQRIAVVNVMGISVDYALRIDDKYVESFYNSLFGIPNFMNSAFRRYCLARCIFSHLRQRSSWPQCLKGHKNRNDTKMEACNFLCWARVMKKKNAKKSSLSPFVR